MSGGTRQQSASHAAAAAQSFAAPLSPGAEAQLLWRIRMRSLATTIGQSLRTARLRVTLVLLLGAVLARPVRAVRRGLRILEHHDQQRGHP